MPYHSYWESGIGAKNPHHCPLFIILCQPPIKKSHDTVICSAKRAGAPMNRRWLYAPFDMEKSENEDI